MDRIGILYEHPEWFKAMAGYAVIEPPPQNILGAVGCADASTAVRGTQYVVDAKPLSQSQLGVALYLA
jgi:hypothetical protein